jgi:di/tricarboxylate transporter
MSSAGWITLATIGVASLLLITERLRPDLVALLVVLALAFTGVVTPKQALAGFSEMAVITIMAVFIMSDGLQRTGVTRWFGQRLMGIEGRSERSLTAALILTAAVFSGFMNTIAAAAVVLPVAMSVSRRAQIPPSRLLMPLAFGALLGGTATLLTTSNIVVSTALVQAGLRAYGLLDFLPVGLPLVFAGTGLMLWLGPRLLPRRDPAGQIARTRRLQTELAQVYHLREGLSQLQVIPGSSLAGQTLAQGGWGQALGLTVLSISHQGRTRLAPGRDTRVEEGDYLIVEGIPSADQLHDLGLRLRAEHELHEPLDTEDVPLIEVILAPRAEVEGKTLKAIHFRERYGIQVVAMWREGLVLQQGVADRSLRFGDTMLMQGPRERIDLLRLDPNFLVLTQEADTRLPSHRAVTAVLILVLSLALAAVGIAPIGIAALAGAVAMLLTGCLSMEEAYRSIEWKAIFMIAGMLPLSIALQATGTAAVLGQALIDLTGFMGSLATAAVLLLGTMGLSLLMGGQTSAIIMAPVAIQAASLSGADPHAMAMGVAIGCSLAFLSPLGHPANMLVMGPGGYTFRDYIRLGAPLSLVCFAVALAGLHWIWGL